MGRMEPKIFCYIFAFLSHWLPGYEVSNFYACNYSFKILQKSPKCIQLNFFNIYIYKDAKEVKWRNIFSVNGARAAGCLYVKSEF